MHSFAAEEMITPVPSAKLRDAWQQIEEFENCQGQVVPPQWMPDAGTNFPFS